MQNSFPHRISHPIWNMEMWRSKNIKNLKGTENISASVVQFIRCFMHFELSIKIGKIFTAQLNSKLIHFI